MSVWIIASLPFWPIGAIFFGFIGVSFYIRREFMDGPGKGDTDLLWGGVLLMLGAGLALCIAARMVT